jgi:hypothetical protein
MDTIDAEVTFVPWYAGTLLEMETAYTLKELRIRRLAARKRRVERIEANMAKSPSRSMFYTEDAAA